MCEIVLIYYLQKQIGETYERSGRDSTLIRILFVVSWILAELMGIGLGVAITGDMAGGLVLGVFGVIGVCVVFFIIANAVPSTRRQTERGYLDDYNEYRATGRISGTTRKRRRRRPDDDDDDDRVRRRDEDDDDDRPRRRVASRDDDDEDDRPRRRAARDDDDDRPRRRAAHDDEDDRPRRGDDRVRRRDEDEEPKPRRRLREDEDY
jgi:phage shock protein PspC (stress-responsive transcriptional regulator)